MRNLRWGDISDAGTVWLDENEIAVIVVDSLAVMIGEHAASHSSSYAARTLRNPIIVCAAGTEDEVCRAAAPYADSPMYDVTFLRANEPNIYI